MNVTAKNVANVYTDGFKKSRTTMGQESSGSVKAVIDQVNSPGPIKQVSDNGVTHEVEGSNVDLVEEFGESVSTQSAYKANLKTIRVIDEMLGSLLDTLA
jgi:flagellar basal-body rod protein FlgC